MKDYVKSKGVVLKLSSPYTPQQNGVAERSNRTVLDCARTLLISLELRPFLLVMSIGLRCPPFKWTVEVNEENESLQRYIW